MAGVAIAAIPKKTIDFTGLAVGSSHEAILVDRVEVTSWRELTMLVLVHGHSLSSGAGTISIKAYPRSFSDEDPGLSFVVILSPVMEVVIGSATPSPTLLTRAFPSNITPQVRLVARGTRTGAGAMNATVSVEISGKDG